MLSKDMSTFIGKRRNGGGNGNETDSRNSIGAISGTEGYLEPVRSSGFQKLGKFISLRK